MLTFKSFLLLEYNREIQKKSLESNPKWADRIKEDPKFSLERLESADPTPNKQYVQRLSIWWLAGAKTEDLISTVADGLETYHNLKLKKKIKPEHSDIGRFKTYRDFLEVLNGYENITPKSNEKELEARGKYKEIYRDADLLVVRLLDETSACFWGQKTKWCTAAKKNNQFENYFESGPLYVIILRKENRKFQLWWRKENNDPDEFMLMNEKDEESMGEIFKITPVNILAKLLPILYKIHPLPIWKIDINNIKKEDLISRILFTRGYPDSDSIYYAFSAIINRGLVSQDILKELISEYPSYIKYIDKPSDELKLIAVNKLPWLISNFKKQTEKLQLAALNAALNKNYNSHSHKNSEIFNLYYYNFKNPTEAVNVLLASNFKKALELIPHKDQTEAVQLAAVKLDRNNYKLIKKPTPKVTELYQSKKSNK